MRIARNKGILIGVALTLGIVAGAAGFWLFSRSPATVATQQLAAAASQRPAGKTDQVIWDYQQRIRDNPRDIVSYAVLGGAYLQKARETGDPAYYSKAQEATDAALRLEPQNVEALIVAGTLANARHQFHEALEIGERARALNSTVPRVYGVIADAQIELGMYHEAVTTIQTMVDMRPDLSSYSRVSYARELHGDLPGAIAAMRLAVSAGGQATENSAWVQVQLGNLFFASGDQAGAEREYLYALTRMPDYVYAQAGLARIRAAQGRTDEAIDLYHSAIARMPLPEFIIALGELEESLGRTAEAAKQYELVRAMQQLFKANGVDTDLDLALFDADHPAGKPGAGGQQLSAVAALARAAYERRPNVKAADTLAWALYKAGDAGEARRYADLALRLGTQDALMLYHAGMIARATGDTAAARDLLGRALALNPHFSPLYAPEARQALARLDAAASN